MNDDLLQAVVDTAIDGLILIEADGRIALFNAACERLFGYTPAEVLGRNVSMLMPEPDRSAHDGYIHRYRSTGEKRIIGIGREVTGRRKDGTVFPFELAVGAYSRDGRQMFVGVIHDLTKYRRSEERFRKVVETAIDGMILIDAQGIVKLFNPACEALFGYAPEEVLGRNVSMLMPEPDRSAHDGYLRHHLTTGEKRIIGIGREVMGRRKDGIVFPFALAVGSFSEDGKPMFVGVIHDLTKYRLSLQQQRESEARFRLLVDSITDYAIFLMDAEGMVLTWNTGAQNLTGVMPEEAIGKTRDVYYAEEARLNDSPANALLIAADKGRYVSEEWRVRKDGSKFWASVVISALRDTDGELRGFVNITRDMSERRQAEDLRDQLRQAQKMEALGQLTGGVAHDFNNLLAVIVGNLELLTDRVSDQESHRLIEQALRNAERGAELTRRLLAFGRQQTLKPARIDVNELVQGILDMLRRTLGDSISIQPALELDVYMVEVDPYQLENAILNIALNARDAMQGNGTLVIRTAITHLTEPRVMPTRVAPVGTYVMVGVRDTGCGMSPDVAARVFEPFYTTKDVGKGSGLGLSMVYGFILQSGGYVELDSMPGAGTEFRLYLPALEGDLLSARRPENEPGRRLVLCVDDNADVRATMTALLGSLGFAVLPAATAADALEELRRGLPIDLLLTDIQMPGGMNGIELADRVLAKKPGMPILFMSGSAGEEQLHHTRYFGISEILPKPVRKAALAEALKKMLGMP
ncbi:MAG: PAS domain S-box protein [Ferrovibrio sp.]|uniref:PAS domain S-box protein n=1 Tax=Ferrovibrio sp. TaxID=1917215 RepID=UPI002627B381|nr:PAS domain S-box protein [Ferrovibrio sp.]MCW0234367.1 PAS domain S-box protein [Ferrovibrio sp.]